MAHSQSQTGRTISVFDEELSVASLSEVSLVIFTNNTGHEVLLKQMLCSGQAHAIYRFLHKAATVYKHRTSEQDRSVDISFNGFIVQEGETIEIKVTNCHDDVADFSGTFILDRSY